VLDHGRVVAFGTPAQLKSQLTEDYVLLDAADRRALEAELRTRGVAFSQERDSIRVDVSGERVHDLLRSIETRLTLVRTHTPTLEDAYLGIIRTSDAEEEEVLQ
jgi:ABC-type multidrug transport system ATPase subunit